MMLAWFARFIVWNWGRCVAPSWEWLDSCLCVQHLARPAPLDFLLCSHRFSLLHAQEGRLHYQPVRFFGSRLAYDDAGWGLRLSADNCISSGQGCSSPHHAWIHGRRALDCQEKPGQGHRD